MTKPTKEQSTISQHEAITSAPSNSTTVLATASSTNPTPKIDHAHPGITIKWSLDSASRRLVGLRPRADSGPVGPITAGGAAWL